MKHLTLSIVVIFLINTQAWSYSVKEQLDSFHKNPKVYMNTPPQKFMDKAMTKPINKSRFGMNDVINNEFVTIKYENSPEAFSWIDPNRPITFAEINYANSPAKLVDNSQNILENLEDMSKKDLTASKLSEVPWSGDYWSLANGVLGARMFDPYFYGTPNWKDKHDYIIGNPYMDIFNSGDQDKINALSPSEKYELILGDTSRTFTTKNWDEGKAYYDRYGNVETWMGICHGWAPAAYMLEKPLHAVEVLAHDDKTKIKFYPSEIKALATHLWANARFDTKFLGERCNDKEPEMDDNGRLLNDKCFDTNPGAWHISVVNQIGISQRSFVLDATYDYEVWNQPVHEYSYKYFNPNTRDEVDKINDAKVKIEDLENDIFKTYRSDKAKYVVGVAMRVSYVVEVTARPTEEASEDYLNHVMYLYDLELDDSGKIIGGEWYTNLHPDFLWSATIGTKAMSPLDRNISVQDWDGTSSLPFDWKNMGQISNRYGLVLGTVVDALIRKSREHRIDALPDRGNRIGAGREFGGEAGGEGHGGSL